MRYLITGAAGFIGSHLYEKLKKEGHEVKGVDNWFHACNNPIVRNVFKVDVRNGAMEGYVRWADVVFHLAAQIHVDYSIKYPKETLDINVNGTLNLLEMVKKYGKEMVLASSSEVYGTAQTEKISENHPLDCQSPYAASKVAAERLAYAYYKTYGTKVSILRNFNTFGPYQADNSYGGVIAIFSRKALRGEPLKVYGDGSQERDYMSVQDAIRGYEFCIERRLWGRSINIGTGKTVKIQRLAEKIIRLTGSKSKIINIEPRPGEVQRLCADTSFAESLGFVINTNFNEDLKSYVQWHKNSIL